MADSIGNKANPVLAGLTGLGAGLFQGFLTRKKMDEEQRQFNEELAFKERQNSLLNAFRAKELEISGFNSETSRMNAETARGNVESDYTTVAEGDQYNQIGVPVGKYPNSLLDNWMQRNKPTQTEFETKVIRSGDKDVTVSVPKGSQITPETLNTPVAIGSAYKPETVKTETDFTLPALVGEINGTFQTLKTMSGDENDPAKAPIKANLMAKTEALMEASGLTSDAGHIWDVVQRGGDVEGAINAAALARGKSFTPKQREYLRLYFKTRYIPKNE